MRTTSSEFPIEFLRGVVESDPTTLKGGSRSDEESPTERARRAPQVRSGEGEPLRSARSRPAPKQAGAGQETLKSARPVRAPQRTQRGEECAVASVPNLEAFWSGKSMALETAYRLEFQSVERAVGRVLHGADAETVVHEVFHRMVEEEEFRRRFRGGSFRAWICTVARHRAIDFARRRGREQVCEPTDLANLAGSCDVSLTNAEVDARRMIASFKAECLPGKWSSLFDLRFLRQMSQRQAAQALGISRTTLAYREVRIRTLLRDYLLRR